MSTTITAGAWSTTPQLVLGIETSRPSTSRVHELIGGGIAVSLSDPDPRKGTLELLYQSEHDALDAEDGHRVPAIFTVASTERQVINGMRYVVAAGDLVLTLDDQTRDLWVLRVPFQEVTA